MFNIISDTLTKTSENHHYDLITLERDDFNEKVWINLEIIGNGTIAESIKRIIQISFEDIFFVNPQKDTYERLEETLKEVNLLLKNLKEKNEKNDFCKINAIIAVLEGQNLHLTQSGDAETYLVRSGKLTVISEGLSVRKNDDSDTFMNIASGEMTFNDVLVYTSQRLLRYLTAPQIAEIFSKNISDALSELKTKLQDTDTLAITCVNFKRSVFSNLNTSKEENKEIMQTEPFQKIKIYFDHLIKIIAQKTGKETKIVEKYTITFGILTAIIVLILGVSLHFSNNLDQEKYAEYNIVITNAENELKNAEKLALMDDNETANAILSKVENKVVQILNEGYFRTESVKILDEVTKLRDTVNNIQRITNPKILTDLSTKRDGINLLGMVNLDNHLYPYEYNALYKTILDKVEEPFKISETESVIEATTMNEKDIIIFSTASNKLIEFQDGQFSLATTVDEMWKKRSALAVYSKYLYLLSPEDNQIWKYERRKSKYEKPSKYNLDADLSKAIDLSIDGNVFVLNEGGEIIKFYRGNRQEFTIKNSSNEDMNNVNKIFTLPDQNNLYLLNSQKNSVLIVKKLSNGNGNYQRQIILEGIGQIVDIHVNQDEQKLFVMDKEKIYEIGL